MDANLQLLLGSILLILVGVGIYFIVVFVQNQSTTTENTTASTSSTASTASTASTTSTTTEDFTTTTTAVPSLTFVQQNVTLITGLIILGALLLVAIIVLILRRMGFGISPNQKNIREMRKRVNDVKASEMAKLSQITAPSSKNVVINERHVEILKNRINQWGFKRVRDMIDNEKKPIRRFRRNGPRFGRINSRSIFLGKEQARAGLVYLYRVAHGDEKAADQYHQYETYKPPALHYQTEVR